MKIKITTERQTKKLAGKIASQLHGGEVIALTGDLGSGKTTFTRYLALALGVKKNVSSPTFVLMKVYRANKDNITHVAHLDAYRLNKESEIEELGLDEYLNKPDAIVVIEWAERLPKFLKKIKRLITIKITQNKNERTFRVSEIIE